MTFMKSWYLLKTKPNQEAIALQNLQNQDDDTYCPNAFIINKKVTPFVSIWTKLEIMTAGKNPRNFKKKGAKKKT